VSYNNQHIVPETYLKHFSEDKFVFFYDFNNDYKTNIQREGIGHKTFWKKKYYSFKGNPSIEKSFSKFENHYNKIIQDLENKTNLSLDMKSLISEWMALNKIRNPYLRDTFSRNIEWLNKTMRKLKKEKYDETILKKNSIDQAKFLQLEKFINNTDYRELIKDYTVNFGSKRWRILIAEEDNILTSINPGFSVTVNFDIFRLNLSPVSSMYNLDRYSYVDHYYPLSSRMILVLEHELFTEEHLNPGRMEEFDKNEIEFVMGEQERIDQINLWTLETSNGIIISKQKETIEKYLNNER
jgi:hypothetical protein